MDRDVITLERTGVSEQAFGGGLEGAERTSRETAMWSPPFLSPDQINNPSKDLADARGEDMARNDGYIHGGVSIHKDSIVGAQYRLNAQPNWRVIGADETWAEEFQQEVEARFNLIAESEACWLDASRMNTLTGLIRLAVGGFVMTGEVLATSEWLDRDPTRPLKTAVQMVSPSRLRNPDDRMDDRFLRRGVERDFYGRPVAYNIRLTHPNEFFFDASAFQSKRIPAEKPWGRRMVVHIIEQMFPDQTRGVADMVSALKQMRMTKRFEEITLQNAVVNASFAAAIESELPTTEIMAALQGTGGQEGAHLAYIESYLNALGNYVGAGRNMQIDGAKIPVFFPGTKLNLKPMGTPGGVGSDFHQSLLRHMSASLGVSYEELSHDFSQVSYSAARASMANTWRFMQSRKKIVADRLANNIYALVLEELIARGDVPLPAGKNRNHFYEPLMKEAYTAATWIGAGRGQIDELKETQAALARIDGGLSTYEQEIAQLGNDWRETFAQRKREQDAMEQAGLSFNTKTKAAKGLGADGTDNTDNTDNADNTDQGGKKKKDAQK